jgi:hypothetical protein
MRTSAKALFALLFLLVVVVGTKIGIDHLFTSHVYPQESRVAD